MVGHAQSARAFLTSLVIEGVFDVEGRPAGAGDRGAAEAEGPHADRLVRRRRLRGAPAQVRRFTASNSGPVTTSGAQPAASHDRLTKSGYARATLPPLAKLARSPVSR